MYVREMLVATGDVLINPSGLIVKLTQEPMDHLALVVLQLKLHDGDWIALQ